MPLLLYVRLAVRAGKRWLAQVFGIGFELAILPVSAALVDERRQVLRFEFSYFTDENDMVAAIMFVRGAAFKTRDKSLEQGDACFAFVPFLTFELVFA